MAEVYKIGVEIALAGTITQGLEAISASLLGINTRVNQIAGGFGRWGLAIGGALALLGTAGIAGALKTLADKGGELVNQQNQLVRLGISYNEVTGLTAKYWSDVASKVPTSTIVDYLRTVKELRAVTGDLATAEKFAPAALKFDELLSNVSGTETHSGIYTLLRAGEMKGIATDPQKLQDLIQQAYSYIAAFGGKLTPAMIQNLAVRGGTAWMNADLKKAFGPMAVLAAEMGGAGGGGGSTSSPGVVLYQLQQLMMGAHTMSKQQAAMFYRLGLIDMEKAKWTGFGKSTLQLEAGAIKGSLQYAGNVPGWAKDILWPALVAAATNLRGTVNQGLLQNYLAKLAPTTNMAKAIELFGNPEFLKQQMKDLGLAAQVYPMDPSYAAMLGYSSPSGYSGPHSRGRSDEAEATKTDAQRQGNYLVVMKALNQQWQSLLETVGGPIAQAAIPLLQKMTEAFTGLGKWASAHPGEIEIIAKAAAGLALVFAALGTAAILAAAASLAPTAAVVAAASGIGIIIGTLAGLHYDAVSSGLQRITAAFNWFIGAIGGIADKIAHALGAPVGGGPGRSPSTPQFYNPHGEAPLPIPLIPGRQSMNFVPPPPASARAAEAAAPTYAGRPEGAAAPLHVKTAVYLDGRVLGEAMSSELARLSTFPRQAAYGDSYVGWAAPDYNFSTG